MRGPSGCWAIVDPEANRAALDEEGWFRTGDVGVIDGGGFVTITGRLKDVINRGGEKFSARDIEDLLAGHPAVRQAAVVPGPDARFGEYRSRSSCSVTAKTPPSANSPISCIPPASRARRRRSHGISSMPCR